MDPINKQTLYNMVDRLSLEFFGKAFEHEVEFNHRLKTTGGRYIPAKRLIELNPKYVTEMDMEEFIGIIKHELCHYHLHIEGKGYKHIDPEFKALLKKTGSPRHCRPLPSQKRKYQYLYKCKQCNQGYKRIRRVNLNKYRCGKCGGQLIQLTYNS